MTTTKIFYDSEFTGLTQDTSLISVGFVTEHQQTFYAEFKDYRVDQADDWIRNHVLVNCQWLNSNQPHNALTSVFHQTHNHVEMLGNRQEVTDALTTWLAQFESVEIWADCLAWDWVLFCSLFGSALDIPKHIHYMPGDLSTLFRVKGFDPDIQRNTFLGNEDKQPHKHNALWDAQIIQRCYNKLMSL